MLHCILDNQLNLMKSLIIKGTWKIGWVRKINLCTKEQPVHSTHQNLSILKWFHNSIVS